MRLFVVCIALAAASCATGLNWTGKAYRGCLPGATCDGIETPQHPPWIGSLPEGTPVLGPSNCAHAPMTTTLEQVECNDDEVFIFVLNRGCDALRPTCLRNDTVALLIEENIILNRIHYSDPRKKIVQTD